MFTNMKKVNQNQMLLDESFDLSKKVVVTYDNDFEEYISSCTNSNNIFLSSDIAKINDLGHTCMKKRIRNTCESYLDLGEYLIVSNKEFIRLINSLPSQNQSFNLCKTFVHDSLMELI
jgi:hypothetical protein